MSRRVLVAGAGAFAARGLAERLEASGWDVVQVSRSSGDDVCNLESCVDGGFDAVVNFVILSGEGAGRNVDFIRGLERFCMRHGVRRLVHISSMGVFRNCEAKADETTPIEADALLKGRYSSIKVAQEQALAADSAKAGGYETVIVRPGVIVGENGETRTGGVCVRIGRRFGVLLGNGRTTLPVVSRSVLHEAVVRILAERSPRHVYHVFGDGGTTKMAFARDVLGVRCMPLPKGLIILLARLAGALRLIGRSRVSQIEGLFKETLYSSSASAAALSVEMGQTSEHLW